MPRVLIVEDEESLGGVLSDVLVDAGYEVRWAPNGQEGLRLLEEWRPEVIVLDLMMPILDGRGFRAAQRRLPQPLAEVPVIVLSGARVARRTAQELGAVATITKPFELEDVPATVAGVLDQAPGGLAGG